MEIWEVDNLKLFLLFFIPGFISLKVYQLFIASDKVDFSKAVFEVIGYSCINFAFFFWVLILIHRKDFHDNHPYYYLIIMGTILFIAPILWTLLFVWVTKFSRLKKYILSPIKGAWDFYFDKKKSCWVIVNLKNGKRIGGIYSQQSFASAYPRREQLYLEEEWVLDKDGESFLNKIERTKGVLILGEDIESIKFLK